MIAAYFLDYHRPGYSRLLGLKELKELYGLDPDPKIHYAAFAHLRKQEVLYGFPDGRAQLTASGYKSAREAVLRYIDGTAIEVDWEDCEVLTDGKLPEDFPLPKGWKWMRWVEPKAQNTSEALGGTVAGITTHGNVRSGDTVGRDIVTTHVLPLPPYYPVAKPGIDWQKLGVIVAIITLAATIILGIMALS